MARELDENDPEAAVIGQERSSKEIDSGAGEGFNALSNEEIERLVGWCEAPALLWHYKPGAPEPFGLIA